MRIASFTIPGEPQGKGRPKFAGRGSYAHAYTPKKTRSYEDIVASEYIRQCGSTKADRSEYVSLTITAYYKIPKSASKKKAYEMSSGKIVPTKKPDIDNIIKVVADALNGVAYDDDKQIIDVSARKVYSETPRVDVRISIIEPEES